MPNLFDSGKSLLEEGEKYLRAKDYDNAIDAFSSAIRKNPNHPLAWVMRGNAYFYRGNVERGDFKKAIDDFDKSLKIDNALMSAYRMRGEAHLRNGDFDKAIRDFNKVLQDDNDNLFSHDEINYSLGMAYRENNNLPSAIHYFLETINLNPKHSRAYLFGAMAYLDQNDTRNAAIFYKRAISINPKLAEYERNDNAAEKILWHNFKTLCDQGLIRSYDG